MADSERGYETAEELRRERHWDEGCEAPGFHLIHGEADTPGSK